jgi:hypothetical protein
MLKVSVKLPKSPGMKVLGIEQNFPLKNLTNKKQMNEVRLKGTDQGVVGQLMALISEGKYEPEYRVPPTVELLENFSTEEELIEALKNGTALGSLITGFHRWQAHEGENQETMYVAIVTFSDHDGMSANYWRKQWKLRENEENKDPKNDRTKEDIVGTIANMVAEKDIDASQIPKALKDAGIKSAAKIATLESEVLGKLGQYTYRVDAVSDKELKTISTKYAKDTGKTVISATFTDIKNIDYDKRALFNVMEEVLAGNHNPKIVARINGANHGKVKQVRKKKSELLKKNLEHILNFAKYYKDNNLTPDDIIDVGWTAQLHDEEGVI